MKQEPKRFYLYLQWPAYLAQFYAFECYKHFEENFDSGYRYDITRPKYELDVVQTIRGTAERDLLRRYLTTQPKNYVPEDDHYTICILVPSFPNMPPEYYNYLSPEANELMKEIIRSRVRLSLYSHITQFWQGRGGPVNLDTLIVAWMDKHGIENRDDSFEALKQIYNRAQNKYHNYKKRHKDE